MDSLRTTNLTGETLRILSGGYNDPVFGNSQAQAFMQFKPVSVSTVLAPTAIYDSIVLRLRYDFYSYGTTGETVQTYAVHEVLDTLFTNKNYYFNSSVSIGRSALGYATKVVNQEFFKSEFDDTNADSLITIRVKLSDGFGQRLFEAIDAEDENYTNFNLFKNIFKGLAVIPSNCDKIVGFNHTDLNSVLTLYYHEEDVKKTVSFSFSQGVTFSKITTDRSTSELAGLDQYYTEFKPASSAYIQAGSSVVTKLDFSKFYEYTDTIPNLVINSAELVITDAEQTSGLYVPNNLALTLLRNSNRYKSFENKQDTIDYINLNGVVTLGDELKFFVGLDQGGILNMNYNSTNRTYIGYPTLYFQRLFDVKSVRYPYAALRPSDPQPGKSVNRVFFPKDRIKLRLYYTRANIDAN